MENRDVQGGDEFTAEEKAYFETGGEAVTTEESTDGLRQEGQQAETNEQAEAEAEGDLNQDQQEAERDAKGRFVPHGALHAERERRKEVEAKLEEITQKFAVLDDRWNTVLKAREAPKEEQAEDNTPPDPEKDIFAYAKWQAQQMEALKEQVTSRERQTAEQQKAQQEEQALWNEWQQSAAKFSEAKPDFSDAAKFLSDARMKQLEALSIVSPSFADEQGRVAQINAELKSIVQAAKAKGLNPAEAVYQIASQYGYTPAQAQQQAAQQQPDQLDKLGKALDASRTIAGAGKTSANPASPEAIASMSAREFEAWYSKPENARLFDGMLGG